MLHRAFLPLMLIVAATAFSANAKKTWRPKPIFTAALCTEELNGAPKVLAEKLTELEVKVPPRDSRDAKANGAYTAFLIAWDRAVRARSRAQARIAGKWKGQTKLKTLKWQGRIYRIGSCQLAKPRIPLNTALRIVTAIKEQSPTDKKIEDIVKGYMKIKNARRLCRTIRPFKKARQCLKKYPKDWLDRYPM